MIFIISIIITGIFIFITTIIVSVIIYNKYKKKDSELAYTWEKKLDKCISSVINCGEGTRNITYECKDNSGNIVDESLCIDEKPSLSSEICQNEKCPQWIVKNKSECSAKCGNGIKEIKYKCVDSLGNELNDAQCLNIKPASTESCNEADCIWKLDGIPSCNVTCGQGIETRSYKCVDNINGVKVDDINCDINLKPELTDKCNIKIECDNDNYTKDYNTCKCICPMTDMETKCNQENKILNRDTCSCECKYKNLSNDFKNKWNVNLDNDTCKFNCINLYENDEKYYLQDYLDTNFIVKDENNVLVDLPKKCKKICKTGTPCNLSDINNDYILMEDEDNSLGCICRKLYKYTLNIKHNINDTYLDIENINDINFDEYYNILIINNVSVSNLNIDDFDLNTIDGVKIYYTNLSNVDNKKVINIDIENTTNEVIQGTIDISLIKLTEVDIYQNLNKKRYTFLDKIKKFFNLK